MNYVREYRNHAGYWSVAKEAFMYMCENGYTDRKPEEWELAEKQSVYDPQKGTTCPLKEELGDLVDNWIKSLRKQGILTVSIHPEDNHDENGNYTKEYRNLYLYKFDAEEEDILNQVNYIAEFGDY